MAQTKSLSFETTVHGTQLRAEVHITPRDGGSVTEQQLQFARALTTHLMDVSAEYQPVEATRNESLDAYVVLADAFQVLDLARASVDSPPSVARGYFSRLASDLDVLQGWDPRFAAACALANRGEQAAGDFDTSGIDELCDALESWMPQRYAAPGFTRRRVLVDDHQSEADFQKTRTPDCLAVSVRMVDEAELGEEVYQVTGRTVLPLPMYPDGSLDTSVDVHALVGDMRVRCSFVTDREDFPLLRALSIAAQSATTARREATPVEFYQQLAYAKRLCWLARKERFAEDGVYRHKLIDELCGALLTVAQFGTEFKTALNLAQLAAERNEDLTSDDVLDVANVVEAWLPRDVRELVPADWDEELDKQLPESLVTGLNALPGRRFVVVFDEQTAEEFAETGLPDKERLVPVDLGAVIDPDVLGLRAVQVFRSGV